VADIFEEVDEDLKHDNFKKLWDRFGRYLVGAVVLVVAGTAANVGWREYRDNRQLGYSEQFIAAIGQSQQGKNVEAAAALALLADDAGGGYAMLARFREAGLRRANGETGAAIDIYDALAADSSIDPLYQNLAVLLMVMMQAESGDPAALSARLTPLAGAGPWRHTAGEYLGLLALRQGDSAAARQRFQGIADDLEAPQGARARAAELLRTLNR
jgi:hypothetical protein